MRFCRQRSFPTCQIFRVFRHDLSVLPPARWKKLWEERKKRLTWKQLERPWVSCESSRKAENWSSWWRARFTAVILSVSCRPSILIGLSCLSPVSFSRCEQTTTTGSCGRLRDTMTGIRETSASSAGLACTERSLTPKSTTATLAHVRYVGCLLAPPVQ